MNSKELITYYLQQETRNIERFEKDIIYNKEQYELHEYAKSDLAESKRISWLRSESKLLDARQRKKGLEALLNEFI